ncbi:unnamed protein product [Amoebophrya sp. A25]|nr:unnamed protein product [Amoebophrya sp. A25]|eukprot:GSA25T00003644001.1
MVSFLFVREALLHTLGQPAVDVLIGGRVFGAPARVAPELVSTNYRGGPLSPTATLSDSTSRTASPATAFLADDADTSENGQSRTSSFISQTTASTGNGGHSATTGGANAEALADQLKHRIDEVENKAEKAEHKAEKAEQKAERAEHEAKDAEHKAERAQEKAEKAEHEAKDAEHEASKALSAAEDAEAASNDAEAAVQDSKDQQEAAVPTTGQNRASPQSSVRAVVPRLQLPGSRPPVQQPPVEQQPQADNNVEQTGFPASVERVDGQSPQGQNVDQPAQEPTARGAQSRQGTSEATPGTAIREGVAVANEDESKTGAAVANEDEPKTVSTPVGGEGGGIAASAGDKTEGTEGASTKSDDGHKDPNSDISSAENTSPAPEAQGGDGEEGKEEDQNSEAELQAAASQCCGQASPEDGDGEQEAREVKSEEAPIPIRRYRVYMQVRSTLKPRLPIWKQRNMWMRRNLRIILVRVAPVGVAASL